jgi:hypothetical protein
LFSRRIWDKRRARQRRFISLALFTSMPRNLTAARLTLAAEKAWNVRATQGSDRTDWVVGEPPLLMAKAEGYHFLVNLFNAPYYALGSDSVTERPPSFPVHGGWISVDLLSPDDHGSDGEVYARAGRLVEALIEADCVALFIPASGRIFTLDTSLRLASIRSALRERDVIDSLEGLAQGKPGGQT